MSSLNDNANRVMQEFGSRIPANLLQFEDARREFIQTRALEMQKLGIADTDKTVVSATLSAQARDGEIPAQFGSMTPAFAEFAPLNHADANYRDKVAIVPVEKIPEYTGGYAIAIYGSRYRTSFDFWESGTIYLWYDAIEDLFDISGADEMAFPKAFETFLVKQSAFNLCGVLMLNLALQSEPEQDERMKIIVGAIQNLQNNLLMQSEQWKREFKKYLNTDFNTQATLRASNDEILARSYGNARRTRTLMYGG